MYIVQKYLLKFVVLFSMMILCSYAFDTSNTTFSNDILTELRDARIDIHEGEYYQENSRPPQAQSVKLGDSAIIAILDLLEPFTEDKKKKGFTIREETRPFPHKKRIIEHEFPTTEQLAPSIAEKHNDTTHPLIVLRATPLGDVTIASHVSITFSKPMVAISAHDEVVDKVPVTLVPQPQGSWRWVGARTLMFEPQKEKLYQATKYTVTVNENAKAIDGEKISGERVFSFSTPPLSIKNRFPSCFRNRTDVPIFIEFDQPIDSAEVIDKIKVTFNDNELGFKACDPEQLPEHFSGISNMIKNAGENHWLLLCINEELPPATDVRVTVAKGTPSLEGPVKTPEDQSFTFRTYDKFTIKKHSCDDRTRYCEPHRSWTFRTNNEIDGETFDSSMVTITPSIEDLEIENRGTQIVIHGQKTPNTEYSIIFSNQIRDKFSQYLSGQKSFTISVDSYRPSFRYQRATMSVANPLVPPSVTVSTVNYSKLMVHVWRVTPEYWDTFNNVNRMSKIDNDERIRKMPGEMVFGDTVKIDGQLNRFNETKIDLKEFLPQRYGHLIVWVHPTEIMAGTTIPPPQYQGRMTTWVQVTNIGLDVWADPARLLVNATSMDKGTPLTGVKISYGNLDSIITGCNGSVIVDLPESSRKILIARKDNDITFMPVRLSRTIHPEKVLFHVFDDRAMYRPGEDVHVKGWVRKITPQVGADLCFPDFDSKVTYSVSDSRGDEIAKGETDLSSLGGFDFRFDIPKTPNLGRAHVDMKIDTFYHKHSFRIEEFRTPEFEVTTCISEGHLFSGEDFRATVNGSYYAGGYLPGASVDWLVRTNPASYIPPHHHEYSFGKWSPWFRNWYTNSKKVQKNISHKFTGKTDVSGNHTIFANVDCGSPPGPLTLTFSASVTDVNRQRFSSTVNSIVHPASYYIGLKTDKSYYYPDREIAVEWIVTDIDGERVSKVPVYLKAELFIEKFVRGKSIREVVETHKSNAYSILDPSVWKFTPQNGGRWVIRAVIKDEKNRHNYTTLQRWVHKNETKSQEKVEVQELTIIPDKESYRPGDTAHLLIQAPFSPAEGVVLLKRYGIEKQWRTTLTDTSWEISIPIKDCYVPNIHLEVHISGVSERSVSGVKADTTLPKHPALANNTINLSVIPVQRTLHISAEPEKRALEPGESTAVNIMVKDYAGTGVPGAEVAVIVVDEAILALSNYELIDPLKVFYKNIPSLVSGFHNRVYIDHETDDLIGGLMGGGGGGGGLDLKMRSSIRLRSDFNPLAAFIPSGTTDSSGYLSAQVKLPDNLTRYRIMVVAADGSRRFGIAESNLTARLPLMVRPSPPRFLNFGDECEMPVVLQNQTDEELLVDIAARAQNLKLKEQGFSLKILPHDRVEVRFGASTNFAGEAHMQVAAVTEKHADAAIFQFPVWTPATSETFATYGTVDAAAVPVSYTVKRPDEILPQFGGVQIATASTELQSLTDAFIYLYNYQFECTEQIASRMISIVALQDVLQAFEVSDIPSMHEIEKKMESDIQKITERQNSNGGFRSWKSNDYSSPFSSLHALHALLRARNKGYTVPQQVIDHSKSYTTNIEQYLTHYYSLWTRQKVIAYSLYVRAVGGDYDEKKARELLKQTPLEKMSIETLSWLLYTLSGSSQSNDQGSDIIRHLHNRVHETVSTAQFNESYSAQDHYLVFHSARRSDAVALEALMKAEPQSDLIVKLVRGLLAGRRKGRWRTTQENMFVLLALDEYFQRYESQTPDFTARTWLDSKYVGEHCFQGRSTRVQQTTIPMRYITETDSVNNLLLEKTGEGRMYYRIGMNYAPKTLMLDSSDHGFSVKRSYTGVDNKDDVVRRDDGTWEMRAGSRVKITITMATPGRRYHVALVDPLPAGLEPVNPALSVHDNLSQESTNYRFRWCSRNWYEHQNLRNERAEAFTTVLWGGVYEYTYYALATTPGNFVVPPAKAEEMYAPETFGRSGSDRVVVIVR